MNRVTVKCPKCKKHLKKILIDMIATETDFGYVTVCKYCKSTIPLTIQRGEDIYITNFYCKKTGKPIWLIGDDVIVAAMAGHVHLMHGYL